VVCYAFSLPPTAFTAQVNRATAENAQDVALAEGLQPLQNWVKHLIDRVIAEEFGAGDLEFAWDADADADPSATATIATDYVKAGIKSINEVRAELGLPPVAGGEQPKIQTAQGLVPLTASAAPAAATQAAKQLSKAGYDPDEPRDGHGRWKEDEGNPFDPMGPARDAEWNSQIATLRQIDPNNPALTYVKDPNSSTSQQALDSLNAAIKNAATARVMDIVAPGGVPVGDEGSSSDVRELPGGLQAAQNMFSYLRVGGTVRPAAPDATVVQLPGNAGYVTFRATSDSGSPAVDINVSGVPVSKIHFP
jgi:hypothetical protein